MSQRLLWQRGGGLGDFLCILPGLHLMKMKRPEWRVSVLCPERWMQLIRFSPAHETLSLDRVPVWKLFNPDAASAAAFRKTIAPFDRIFWHAHPGTELAEALLRIAPEKMKILDPHPLRDGISAYRHCAQAADFPFDEADWARIPGRLLDAKPEIIAPSTPILAWHPGSGSALKNWPLERAIQTIEECRKFEPKIRVVGFLGPAENAEAIKTLCSHLEIDWVENQEIGLAARRLAAATAYLGNDSGITHLASALGIAGAAIYKNPDSITWKPWGKRIAAYPFDTAPSVIAGILRRLLIDTCA
jgi:heptosyltransferase III